MLAETLLNLEIVEVTLMVEFDCVMLRFLEKETVGRTCKGKVCCKKRWVKRLLNNWSA